MREPGWDMKLLTRIAKEQFGGWAEMFVYFGWDEPPNRRMVTAPSYIVKDKRFGSIEAFAKEFGANYG